MSSQERRERERNQRRRVIVDAARELAEAEGWEAVTTRRLADRIEYSQPVLYGHFEGMVAIVSAVAVEGFAELAAALRAARQAVAAPDAGAAVATAYLDFAAANPAVYEAMFARSLDVVFARSDTPAPLSACFVELRAALEPVAGPDADTFTEVFWSALHGLAALSKAGRLRPGLAERRLAVLLDRLAAAGG